jgi:hypothetical protein
MTTNKLDLYKIIQGNTRNKVSPHYLIIDGCINDPLEQSLKFAQMTKEDAAQLVKLFASAQAMKFILETIVEQTETPDGTDKPARIIAGAVDAAKRILTDLNQ